MISFGERNIITSRPVISCFYVDSSRTLVQEAMLVVYFILSIQESDLSVLLPEAIISSLFFISLPMKQHDNDISLQSTNRKR